MKYEDNNSPNTNAIKVIFLFFPNNMKTKMMGIHTKERRLCTVINSEIDTTVKKNLIGEGFLEIFNRNKRTKGKNPKNQTSPRFPLTKMFSG